MFSFWLLHYAYGENCNYFHKVCLHVFRPRMAERKKKIEWIVNVNDIKRQNMQNMFYTVSVIVLVQAYFCFVLKFDNNLILLVWSDRFCVHKSSFIVNIILRIVIPSVLIRLQKICNCDLKIRKVNLIMQVQSVASKYNHYCLLFYFV